VDAEFDGSKFSCALPELQTGITSLRVVLQEMHSSGAVSFSNAITLSLQEVPVLYGVDPLYIPAYEEEERTITVTGNNFIAG